jgi:REP element-mobilizing transposase RayT
MDMRVAPQGSSLQGLHHVVVATRRGQRYFEPFASACAASRAFTDARTLRDARLLAWVLMPDHAHWLLQPGPGESIAQVVTRMKARSGHAVNRLRGEKRPVWASSWEDRALAGHEDARSVARFIVANPLRAGVVRSLADYPFWDAAWL